MRLQRWIRSKLAWRKLALRLFLDVWDRLEEEEESRCLRNTKKYKEILLRSLQLQAKTVNLKHLVGPTGVNRNLKMSSSGCASYTRTFKLDGKFTTLEFVEIPMLEGVMTERVLELLLKNIRRGCSVTLATLDKIMTLFEKQMKEREEEFETNFKNLKARNAEEVRRAGRTVSSYLLVCDEECLSLYI